MRYSDEYVGKLKEEIAAHLSHINHLQKQYKDSVAEVAELKAEIDNLDKQ